MEKDPFITIPDKACGMVLFVHGSGSSRFSPRNQYVARILNEGGIATYLFDLLTPEEEERRFDIPLLTERIGATIEWAKKFALPIALFGASTGAAAALIASIKKPISAIVSRGGRPDLASEFLPEVTAPTLLIVGGNDDVVIEMNKEAYSLLQCEKQLSIIAGATHLFEEEGTLEEVAKQAQEWFSRHFRMR